MTDTVVTFNRATPGSDGALFKNGPTTDGQSTVVPYFSIYGSLPDTAASDLATIRAGITSILAAVATQTTLAAILAKMLAAPSTEAKQDAIKTAIDAITAKLIAAPATEASLALVLAAVLPGSVNVCNKVVTVTAGTAVQLPSQACRQVTVMALSTNTGIVYAGASNISSTTVGFKTDNAGGFTFLVNNANLVWINSSVSGEGFSYVIN